MDRRSPLDRTSPPSSFVFFRNRTSRGRSCKSFQRTLLCTTRLSRLTIIISLWKADKEGIFLSPEQSLFQYLRLLSTEETWPLFILFISSEIIVIARHRQLATCRRDHFCTREIVGVKIKYNDTSAKLKALDPLFSTSLILFRDHCHGVRKHCKNFSSSCL